MKALSRTWINVGTPEERGIGYSDFMDKHATNAGKYMKRILNHFYPDQYVSRPMIDAIKDIPVPQRIYMGLNKG